MAAIGYAHLSARDGHPVFDRQMDALRAAGCEQFPLAGEAPGDLVLPEPWSTHAVA